MNNTLINRLWDTIQQRNSSVAKFADETGIPVDRVYKWKSKGTHPKAEDSKKIEGWIKGIHPDIVPHGTKSGTVDEIFLNGPVKLTAQEYVDTLKADKKRLEEDNKQLQGVINVSLQAMQQLLSSLSRHDRAYHETILMSLARIEKRPSENDLIVIADTRESEKLLKEQNMHNEAKDIHRKSEDNRTA